jgi:hypothetical protein
MNLLNFLLMAPIFLSPSEEGPAVMTPDGLAWHRIDAKTSRDFDIPRRGQLVILVRRIEPAKGSDDVRVSVHEGEVQIWSTNLGAGRGAQLGSVVAGRAKRGSSKGTVDTGKVSVSTGDNDHQGILIQLELIPDLGPPAQDSAALRASAGADTLEDAQPKTKAGSSGLNLNEPALVAPAAEPPLTVAKASVPKASARQEAAVKSASVAAKPVPKAPVAAPSLTAPKKLSFVASVDGGLGLRQVWGGLMTNNASFRLGADLRKELLPNIKLGLELRFATVSAEGNASIPMSGMTASANRTTVRRAAISGWAMPLLVRLTQSGTGSVQTVLLVGPAFGNLSITPGNRAAQSHGMTGMSALVRLQPKSGIAIGPTQLLLGAELGWQGLWADKVSASRGFIGLDLGFPWSL